MGFTPLEGLVMGQRCGDIDPSIVDFLEEEEHLTTKKVLNIFNKQSGLLGLSEKSSDMRKLLKISHEGDEKATLAIDIFCYRLAKKIASYIVPLEKIDALVFTGGIGENAAPIREKTMALLTPLSLKALVIPTNEEKMIALDALRLTEGS